MRHFIYRATADRRTFEEVDIKTLYEQSGATLRGEFCISQGTFNEGRANGDTYHVVYITPEPLDLQGKVLAFGDCVNYIDRMQVGDRIPLAAPDADRAGDTP